MEEQKNNIIAILDQKRDLVEEDRDTLASVIIGVQNLLERYYTKDNAFVKQAEVLHSYIIALQSSKKDQYRYDGLLYSFTMVFICFDAIF